ncbi:16345_t:CDS:2, partial [Funneliformis mosseae]
MVHYNYYNYPRNLRFYHPSDKVGLVGKSADENEKSSGGAGEPPIISKLPNEDSLTKEIMLLYKVVVSQTFHKSKLKKLQEHLAMLAVRAYVNGRNFADKIEKLLNDEWPGHDIKVHMFGSSMNLLGTTQSDVDLCVKTQWNGLKSVQNLSKCLKNRERHGNITMRAQGQSADSKVMGSKPVKIITDFDIDQELACDININNTLALHNTRLIRNYVTIDSRVRPLAMVVKHWARKRVLNDAAKGGTISTYTWTCIVLNFLQMRNPPILPVLHNLPHDDVEPIIVNGEDASFYENVLTLEGFGSKNKESVGGLLFGFFRRMAYEFDYEKHVISLRHGKYLTKAEKGWDTCKGWKMLCVEEPFNTTRNLGNSADDISVEGLKGEFRRAYKILYDSANLNALCEQYISTHQYNNNYYNYRSNKSNYVWKPNNRKPGYPHYKYHQNGHQGVRTNHDCDTIDNFHDMNGKSSYPQDARYVEGDESNAPNTPRFVQADDVPSSRKDVFCPTINGEEFTQTSETMHVDTRRMNGYYENTDVDKFNAYQNRKKVVSEDDIPPNRRERTAFPEKIDDESSFASPTTTHDNSQFRYNVTSTDPKNDEQFSYKGPSTRQYKSDNFNRQGSMKKKNDKRYSHTRSFNIDHNFSRISVHDSVPSHSVHKSNQDIENEESSKHFSPNYNANTTPNTFYKHNNQKADNNSYQKHSRTQCSSPLRYHNSPRSDRRSSFSQNSDSPYNSDVKYNNNNGYSNYSRRSNTPSDLDQKPYLHNLESNNKGNQR